MRGGGTGRSGPLPIVNAASVNKLGKQHERIFGLSMCVSKRRDPDSMTACRVSCPPGLRQLSPEAPTMETHSQGSPPCPCPCCTECCTEEEEQACPSKARRDDRNQVHTCRRRGPKAHLHWSLTNGSCSRGLNRASLSSALCKVSVIVILMTICANQHLRYIHTVVGVRTGILKPPP